MPLLGHESLQRGVVIGLFGPRQDIDRPKLIDECADFGRVEGTAIRLREKSCFPKIRCGRRAIGDGLPLILAGIFRHVAGLFAVEEGMNGG